MTRNRERNFKLGIAYVFGVVDEVASDVSDPKLVLCFKLGWSSGG